MIDTLKIAEGLQEGAAGFPPEQARKLAHAIGQMSDDKRLKDLEVKVGVQNVLFGLFGAVLVAMFWQLLTLRGELSGGIARMDERLAGMQRTADERAVALQKSLDQRFDSLDRRLGAIEQRLQRP